MRPKNHQGWIYGEDVNYNQENIPVPVCLTEDVILKIFKIEVNYDVVEESSRCQCLEIVHDDGL